MNIKIDFDEITTDQFIELDSINESFITDGNVDYTKIIDYYNQFTNYECD